MSENRPRILLVEDDELVARDLCLTMERLGHGPVDHVASGEEALARAAASHPLLVLMDVRLRGHLDGIETALRMRESLGLPVVFITGYSGDAVLERARQAKPIGYLRKPFSDAELAACVEAACEQAGQQRALLERERSLGKALSGLGDAVVAADLEGRITFVNDNAIALLGLPAGEAIGARLEDWIETRDPLSRERKEISVIERLDGDKGRHLLLQLRNGREVTVEERSAPVRSSRGDVLGAVLILRELATALPLAASLAEAPPIPVRLKPVRELLGFPAPPPPRPAPLVASHPIHLADDVENSGEDDEREQTRLSFDEITDPLLAMDGEGMVLYGNAVALAEFGGKSPLVGQLLWSRFAPGLAELHGHNFLKPQLDGEPHTFEMGDDLRSRWYEVRAYRSGEVTLAIFRDITHRKQTEAEKTRLQRLEGLGLLARGFAHEFNNQLTVLMGNLELARERYPQDPRFQEEMHQAFLAAGGARGLVQQLLTFAKGGQPVRKAVRVAPLIRRVLDQHRRAHPRVRYQFQCSNPLLEASLDGDQITRLIENLTANAEAAMQGGGALIVRVATISSQEAERLRGMPPLLETDHLVIEVIDTGRGMTPEELAHAFEPYYTTRAGDNATGIGLTVCESIARGHEGFIVLQSRETLGTIASVCLPFSTAHSLDPYGLLASSPPGPFPPAMTPVAQDDLVDVGSQEGQPEELCGLNGKRVLVLEDDAKIRRLISATLGRSGCEVIETADGRDTLRRFQEDRDSGRPVDLIICDLTIVGGLGGVETMHEIRRLDGEVPAIVSSGYSDAPAMAHPEEYGFNAVLPKPYPPSELRRMVLETLEAKIRV